MDRTEVRTIFDSRTKAGEAPVNDRRIVPGGKADFPFSLGHEDGKRRYRLLFKGETDRHYFWKSEAQCFSQYVSIADALERRHAYRSAYAVDLSNRAGENYPKALYKKLIWPPRLSYLALYGFTDDWKAGVYAHAEDLVIEKDGYLRVCFEIYDRRPGVSPYDLTHGPDRVVTVDIPGGSYAEKEISSELYLPYTVDPNASGAPIFGSDPGSEIAALASAETTGKQTAALAMYIEGWGYHGGLWVEAPFVTSSNGWNIMYDFAPPASDHEEMDWIGQNLSRSEWPEFSLSLNGTEFFRGERFERCQRYSEWEVELPEGLLRGADEDDRSGENVLTVSLLSGHRDTLPYRIGKIMLLSSPSGKLTVEAVPSVVPVGRRAGILIRTEIEGMEAEFTCPDGRISASPRMKFGAPGLHVYPIEATVEGCDLEFFLDGEKYGIGRAIEKAPGLPDVITGSGDMVYVNTENLSDVDEYLRWYIANECGNLVTLRPVYRWTGCRVMNEDNWRHIASLIAELGLYRAHMLDGREINGIRCNPPPELLGTEENGFLGRQTHEYDGAFLYWAQYMYRGNGPMELNADFTVRECRKAPVLVEPKKGADFLFVRGDRHYVYRDYDNMPTDMLQGEELCVKMLDKSRRAALAPRHTGPSTAFRCFAKAGYEQIGAELMYGPTELICSFLRGVRDCFGIRRTMAHLAVQWSTSPHDVPERWRRYRLALYICYMQDVDEINTEEGLWHLEEYYSSFDRFSEPCRMHRRQQNDFYSFTRTHERSGRFETPFAFISGRADGWRSFGRDGIWGNPALPAAEPEDSWDLLKIFYPLTNPTGDIYLHPCPTDREVGFYTGTPRGQADALPIESSAELMKNYPCLFFAGYNHAEKEDFARLADYVRGGGVLVLGWPHLSLASERKDVLTLNGGYLDCELSRMICGGACAAPVFTEDSKDGHPITAASGLCGDLTVIDRTDSGRPLVVSGRIGSGIVYFINAAQYPADPALFPVYSAVISSLADGVLASRPFGIECGDDVQYAVRRQDDGTVHLYLLAVDWYRDPETKRKAVLRLGQTRYPLELDFGVIYKIVVSSDCEKAAWSLDETGEVRKITGEGILCRGRGNGVFAVASDGTVKRCECPFDRSGQALL